MNPPSNRRPQASETWLEVVAAVDYLSRGHRPGFTVWDAVEEALRWYTAHLIAGDDDRLAAIAAADLPWDDPDPLRTALERLVEHHPPASDAVMGSAEAIDVALVDWLAAMALEHNDGHRFTLKPRGPAVPAPLAVIDANRTA